MGDTQLGLDRVRLEPALLGDVRSGLVTNYTGLTANLDSAVDVLLDAGVDVRALFGPEHGIGGSAQDGGSEPEITVGPRGLPVYDTYRVTGAALEDVIAAAGVDQLVFDIQDIGSRFYTYAWTMYDCMVAAGRLGLGFVVLDRPNPIGGTVSEGPAGEPEFFSFVGRAAIPIRHGLTLGELARHLNVAALARPVNLRVIELRGWDRRHYADETGLPWVMPSPNMPSLDTAIVYPGTCLFEGTNISEGRGTTRPFELIGAPFFDSRLRKAFHNRGIPGVRLREAVFTPTFRKYQGQSIPGVQLHVTDRAAFRPVETALALLEDIITLYPEEFSWTHRTSDDGTTGYPIDLLWGSAALRNAAKTGSLCDLAGPLGKPEEWAAPGSLLYAPP